MAKNTLSGSQQAAQAALDLGAVASESYVSGQYLCTPVVYAPGSPASMSVASATYAALDSGVVCTGPFTAPPSGSVKVVVTCVVDTPTAIIMGFALAAEGTVTPLAAPQYTIESSSTNIHPVQSFVFIITGLTSGSSYNFDVLAAAKSSSFTVTASGQTTTSLGSAANGGPVTVETIAI